MSPYQLYSKINNPTRFVMKSQFLKTLSIFNTISLEAARKIS